MIANSAEDNLSPEEREIRDWAKPQVETAQAKYNEDTDTERKKDFIGFINETHVPQEVRAAIPGDYSTQNPKKLARWVNKSISASIHPDNYRDAPKE